LILSYDCVAHFVVISTSEKWNEIGSIGSWWDMVTLESETVWGCPGSARSHLCRTCCINESQAEPLKTHYSHYQILRLTDILGDDLLTFTFLSGVHVEVCRLIDFFRDKRTLEEM
jgi:hypothetical protein